MLSTRLTSLQGREKLVQTERAEDGQPWEISAGIAMGAFRGIFVNFLWIRANEMKEAGKFFEAIDLASAITRLQPRFPRVWIFHAWNMAYNISVQTQTSEERWTWVNAGVRLLRDKGIPNNPNDMLLHKELGWIFLHKIGGYTDDANAYYKRRLAMEWTVVMGNPPRMTKEDRSREHRIKVMSEWLGKIASAPNTLQEAIEIEPNVKVIAERLAEIGYKPDFQLLGRYEMHRASRTSQLREVYMARILAGRKSENQPSPMEKFIELVDDPNLEAAWDVLVSHVRKRLLIEEYKMDPDRMVRYTQKYGPMDWRHHAAHALYWSAKGVEDGFVRITKDNRRDFDTLNTDRITVQAIQDLFRTGELYFDFFAFALGSDTYAMFQGVPNAHFVRAYGDIIESEVRDRSWADQVDQRGITPLSGGYENFLKDAICFFYRRGQLVDAEYWYDRLNTYENLNLNNKHRADEMSKPLSEFVERELNDRATSPNVAIAQISGALMGAYTSGLLAADQELFTSQFEYAKAFHRYFFNEQRKAVVVNQQYVRMDQMEPDFRLAAGMIFAQWITTLGLDDAQAVYGRAPEDLRRFAYDIMQSVYVGAPDVESKGVKMAPETFARTFPQPSGMAEFRVMLQGMLEDRGQSKIDAEQK